ncbi:MAG: glutathione S-transferase [Leptolyngbya foveolarum]|uniref:Glutathione S-transferase n=1 Tax=Leptolyngbya foveolarum TaxID=47253 RepID=A0A2W4WDD4_9CYAN|nr:MAG: glutathione S-transferase [Leptolyngbya foveolarum]
MEEPAERLIPVEETADIPEEILRTEIITGARSPLTGEPLTAAEYAQLQEALANPVEPNRVSDDIRYLVFLLQLRRAVRPILPFIR